jgi:hypothetical protein
MRHFRNTGIFVTTACLALAGSTVGAQTDPPGFVQVLRREIAWTPHPTIAGGQVAVLVGNPSQPGPLVLRLKLPANVKVMPHTHPEARTYTVLGGEWKLGFGEAFDAGKLRTFPAGSVYRLPANAPHFQATGATETIVQIESVGPTATRYVNPADEPAKKP